MMNSREVITLVLFQYIGKCCGLPVTRRSASAASAYSRNVSSPGSDVMRNRRLGMTEYE